MCPSVTLTPGRREVKLESSVYTFKRYPVLTRFVVKELLFEPEKLAHENILS